MNPKVPSVLVTLHRITRNKFAQLVIEIEINALPRQRRFDLIAGTVRSSRLNSVPDHGDGYDAESGGEISRPPHKKNKIRPS